jgi:CxxC-x17-CxxC domain-containing protein
MKEEAMDFTDQTLVCATCGQPFSFTAREQAFYREKGFQHTPKRCRDCRRAKRAMQSENGDGVRHGSGNGNRPRALRDPGQPAATYSAVCSACGAEVELSFKPDGVRPVYCRPCFDERRRQPRA